MTAEQEPATKKAGIERAKIWFLNKDLDGVQLPHNDPLVLTLKLKNFMVQRVLVDLVIDPLLRLLQEDGSQGRGSPSSPHPSGGFQLEARVP